jgi:hypothetical protein
MKVDVKQIVQRAVDQAFLKSFERIIQRETTKRFSAWVNGELSEQQLWREVDRLHAMRDKLARDSFMRTR